MLTNQLLSCLHNNNELDCYNIYKIADWETQIDWVIILNELNDINGCFMHIFGYAYKHGKGVKKDLHKGFEWYLKSAIVGNGSGMNNVGYAYNHGKGVKKDLHKGFEWYLKSVIVGNATGMNNVGYAYYYGKGVKKDLHKGFEWFLKSAIVGNATGMYNVAYAYQYGNGVEKDQHKAFEWFLKSAIVGNGNATATLMNGFSDKLFNEIRNLKKKNKILKKENLELSLRPPNLGGPEYENAKTRYYKK